MEDNAIAMRVMATDTRHNTSVQILCMDAMRLRKMYGHDQLPVRQQST